MFAYLRFYAPLLTWKAKMGGLGDAKKLVEAATSEA